GGYTGARRRQAPMMKCKPLRRRDHAKTRRKLRVRIHPNLPHPLTPSARKRGGGTNTISGIVFTLKSSPFNVMNRHSYCSTEILTVRYEFSNLMVSPDFRGIANMTNISCYLLQKLSII